MCVWNPQTILWGKLVLWQIELAFNCGVLASLRSESSRCRDRRFAKAECESSDWARTGVLGASGDLSIAFQRQMAGIYIVNDGLRYDMFLFWGDSFNFQLLPACSKEWVEILQKLWHSNWLWSNLWRLFVDDGLILQQFRGMVMDPMICCCSIPLVNLIG